MNAFDADLGVLSIPDQAFDALIAIRRDSEQHIHPSHLHHVELLHRLGALTEAGVHRCLLEGLSAVAAKQVELNIRVSTPDDTMVRQAWLLGDAVGWVTPTATGVEFRCGTVDRVPEVLAQLIGLGPRRDPAAQLRFAVSRRVFDALLAGDEANRRQGAQMMAVRSPGGLPDWEDDLVKQRWRSWHFEMKWQTGKVRHGRAVIGVELPVGYLVADPSDEMRVDVQSTRAIEVWRRLLRLLPPAEALVPHPMGRHPEGAPPF